MINIDWDAYRAFQYMLFLKEADAYHARQKGVYKRRYYQQGREKAWKYARNGYCYGKGNIVVLQEVVNRIMEAFYRQNTSKYGDNIHFYQGFLETMQEFCALVQVECLLIPQPQRAQLPENQRKN